MITRVGLVLAYIETLRGERKPEVDMIAVHGTGGQLVQGYSQRVGGLRRGHRKTWIGDGFPVFPMVDVSDLDYHAFKVAFIERDGGRRRVAKRVAENVGRAAPMPALLTDGRQFVSGVLGGILGLLLGGRDDPLMTYEGSVRASRIEELTSDVIEVSNDRIAVGFKLLHAEPLKTDIHAGGVPFLDDRGASP